MTTQITSIQSAKYDEHNRVVFTVTVGDITGVETFIFDRPQDRANDLLLRGWLADSNHTVEAYIPDPIPEPEPVATTRRLERDEIFSGTLDRLNPLWFNSLTETQRSSLITWRQAWLDYPETGIRPNSDSIIEGIFN